MSRRKDEQVYECIECEEQYFIDELWETIDKCDCGGELENKGWRTDLGI